MTQIEKIKDVAYNALAAIGMVALALFCIVGGFIAWASAVFLVVAAIVTPIAVISYVFGQAIGAW